MTKKKRTQHNSGAIILIASPNARGAIILIASPNARGAIILIASPID